MHDLAPLKGAPLKFLCLDGTAIEKLDALAGMPLSVLRISHCRQLRDITVLGTLPIEELDAGGCEQVADFSPLLKCPNLQNLIISRNCRDLESIRRLPKLKKLTDLGLGDFGWNWDNVPAAEATLRDIDERRAQEARLKPATGQEGKATMALLETRLKPLVALPGWQTPAEKPRLVDNGDGTETCKVWDRLPIDFSSGSPRAFLRLKVVAP